MRFQSKYANPTFTVRSEVLVGDIKGRPPVTGLRVEFRGNEFDSELAQVQNGWTDEERLHVEQWLTSSREYGVGKTFWLRGAEVAIDTEGILASIRPDYCSRTKITAAGPEPCGNPTAEGSIFCMSCLLELNSERAEQAAAQEITATARTRAPGDVGVPLTGPARNPATGRFLPRREPAGV